ncbi:MAG: DUF2459 domain-containing protein [Ignavibacteriaceae bacterium]|nr:DUF2459 domain-containing protein [Ignavibacteriaceae bacterium]
MIIIPIIIFFLNTYPTPDTGSGLFQNINSAEEIFIVKQRWHTGFVFKAEQLNNLIWQSSAQLKNYRIIDVGWGDQDFYQYPGFDFGLAFKALFLPTPSTLRVEGFYMNMEDYKNYCDIVVMIKLSEVQLNKIFEFIQSTYVLDDNSNPVLLSQSEDGSINFYKAKGSYHLFNTCNSWIAKGLKQAGLPISDDITIAGQLFNQLQNFGVVIKGFEE